tara:strand:+ start:191 stop:403 length:213 start_codon:yes stop_codon:yes gene_type:complete
MKVKYEPRETEEGFMESAYYIEKVCGSCGYDLTEDEIAADTCVDCGETLQIKQSVSIRVTTLPPIFSGSM